MFCKAWHNYPSVKEYNPHKSVHFAVQKHSITHVPAFEYHLSVNLRQFNVTEQYSPVMYNGERGMTGNL